MFHLSVCVPPSSAVVRVRVRVRVRVDVRVRVGVRLDLHFAVWVSGLGVMVRVRFVLGLVTLKVDSGFEVG